MLAEQQANEQSSSSSSSSSSSDDDGDDFPTEIEAEFEINGALFYKVRWEVRSSATFELKTAADNDCAFDTAVKQFANKRRCIASQLPDLQLRRPTTLRRRRVGLQWSSALDGHLLTTSSSGETSGGGGSGVSE